MRAYVMTTGVLFGLITLAHVWRVIEEGRGLAGCFGSRRGRESA